MERDHHAEFYLQALKAESESFHQRLNNYNRIQKKLDKHIQYITKVQQKIESWFCIDVPNDYTDVFRSHFDFLPSRVVPSERWPIFANASTTEHINYARQKVRRAVHFDGKHVLVQDEGDKTYPPGQAVPRFRPDAEEPTQYNSIMLHAIIAPPAAPAQAAAPSAAAGSAAQAAAAAASP